MCHTGTNYFAIKNKAPISASTAEDITYFMICAMVKSGPFQRGIGSLSDRNVWASDLLLAFVSLLKPESEYEVRIISLDKYNSP